MEKRVLLIKKSQITIFVIIALLIIVGIAGFFLLKDKILPKQIPENIRPVYDYYISCVEDAAKTGANILGTQGGYIELPEFEPGSQYAPFSSQFGFAGFGIPYWYYISANNVPKEQIPTKRSMEEQLGNYIAEEIEKCDFTDFTNSGFNISLTQAQVRASIADNKISLIVNQRVNIGFVDSSYALTDIRTDVDSQLGEFYNLANKIYDYEKSSMFLENYSVDVLYNYAPVEGVVLNCSPTFWSPYNVFSDLKGALEANIQSIKMSGAYYSNAKYANYFVAGKNANIDVGNSQVNFLYSKDWPSRFEVWPTKNNLMVAEPIGNQPGLSVMGFCYAPYKFVYDMYFPVLVQIFGNDAEEVFQFPVSIVIQKNVPREALPSENIETSQSVCDNANTDITVNTYNVNLEPVEADIEFKCFTSICRLGKTRINNVTGVASLSVKAPQCVNGMILANSDGYKEKKYVMSTNEEYYADIVLDREYKLSLEIYVDNVLSNEFSIVTISANSENSTDFSDSVSYPFKKEITLSEGDYDFELRVYKSGSLTLPATTTTQCTRVPKTGLLGMFGMDEEKCYDVNVPSQTLANLPLAGGYTSYYVTPDQLASARSFKIYATSIRTPTNLEEVQTAYDDIENKRITIEIA